MSIGDYFRIISVLAIIAITVYFSCRWASNTVDKIVGLGPEIKKRKMLKKLSDLSYKTSQDLLSIHCICTSCSKCPYYRHVITPDDYENFIKSINETKKKTDDLPDGDPRKLYLYNTTIWGNYNIGTCIFKEIQRIIDGSLK